MRRAGRCGRSRRAGVRRASAQLRAQRLPGLFGANSPRSLPSTRSTPSNNCARSPPSVTSTATTLLAARSARTGSRSVCRRARRAAPAARWASCPAPAPEAPAATCRSASSSPRSHRSPRGLKPLPDEPDVGRDLPRSEGAAFDLVVFDEASRSRPTTRLACWRADRARSSSATRSSYHRLVLREPSSGEDERPTTTTSRSSRASSTSASPGASQSAGSTGTTGAAREPDRVLRTHHYYKNRLNTFPSALAFGRAVAASRLQPDRRASTTRVESRTNKAEAQAVVADHRRAPPLTRCGQADRTAS